MMRPIATIAAVFGAAAVLLGAFGAHGLEGRVVPARLEVWNTAAHYLGWQATALLALAALWPRLGGVRLAVMAAGALVAGTLVFSGSLFLLVLTDLGAWGAVTPFGGVLLVLGWLLLAAALWRGLGEGGPRSG
jgi:uncharacterized membrane protein YgdD (TMEM256/DUF423 family)